MSERGYNRAKIPPFSMLRAFEAVGSLGGIRKAAETININHTVVSRHIRALEEWLDVPLLHRAGRGVTLTPDGEAYHARIVAALAEIADATSSVTPKRDLQQLRIRAVPGFGYQWLSANLGQFRAQHPQVLVDLRMTDQISDFVSDGADVDIRWIPDIGAPQSEHRVRSISIARPQVIAVASPEYLSRSSAIKELSDLHGHILIHEEDDNQWRNWFMAHGETVLGPLKGSTLWHAHVVLEAALHGEGLALANRLLLRDYLDTGRLVAVGPHSIAGFPIEIGDYRLFCRSEGWENRTIVGFRNWITSTVHA